MTSFMMIFIVQWNHVTTNT